MKIAGFPTLFDADPYSSTSIQQHPLGTWGVDKIGRLYRYAYSGAVALVTGNLIQSPARSTDFTDLAVAAAVAVGATSIQVTLGATATTANQFDNGVVAITVTPGGGQQFSIAACTVTAGSGTATLTLNEPVVALLSTSSKITIRQNLFNRVIQSPTTRTGKTVGVALNATPINHYTWIGAVGSFGVLSDSTVAAVGESLSPSTTTAGAVTKQVTLLESVGTADVLGISAKWEPVTLACW